MRVRTALVVLAGLATVVGCARQDRWTLEKDGDGGYQWSYAHPQPEAMRARSDVELMQANGIATIRNKNGKRNIVVTLHGMPGDPAEKSTTFQVFVPAASEVQVGRPGRQDDPVPASEKWTYSVKKVAYN